MEFDLEGFIRGSISLAPTPPRKCLLPLYEAVSNSIHGIQEAQTLDRQVKGEIEITIRRDARQDVLRAGDHKVDLCPVDGFDIRDNGIGFNTPHFDSFNTAFSQLKRHLGAKGRGRFMWLKVFARASVESILEEHGKLLQRGFAFTIERSSEGGQTPATTPDGAKRMTLIKLERMRKPFKDHCPKHPEAIAGHLVRRFVEFLALPGSPTMTLIDPGTTSINLNDWFKNLNVKATQTAFKVNEKDFSIKHMLLTTPAINN
ncbi:MAG: hypothetical protein C4547_00585 [Phycisphaerales bacterium]|nr:MAG: hypothetical protein C4547_00585 [Phycisphaerales bacterium]